jgi:hypothetical protein
MVEEKKETKESKYELVQVPTGQALAIQTPEGEVISTEFALVEILNVLRDIKKVMA